MTRSHVTTHVLDTRTGTPAAGMEVVLEQVTTTDPDGSPGTIFVARATTDPDGRVEQLGPEALEPGTYRLRFATGPWFASSATANFYPEIVVAFALVDTERHHHVPLLLSPFAYSTYRGS